MERRGWHAAPETPRRSSMVATAYLMVRAVVADAADRPGCNRWYET